MATTRTSTTGTVTATVESEDDIVDVITELNDQAHESIRIDGRVYRVSVHFSAHEVLPNDGSDPFDF